MYIQNQNHENNMYHLSKGRERKTFGQIYDLLSFGAILRF